MKLTLFVAFALVAISWQCVLAEETTEKTFIIAPYKFCRGFVIIKCLQVKEKPTDEWRNFYDDIEGFTFEPGYEYVVRVSAERIKFPALDGPAFKYTLLEQVSKTKHVFNH